MSDGANLSVYRTTPVIDFTSSDFDALKADMRSYAQATYGNSGWTDFSDNQPGVVLFDIVAYLGDLLTYQLNSHMRELYASTVLRRANLQRIGKPFGYSPAAAESATTTMRLTLDPAGTYPFTLLRSHSASNQADGDSQVYYHPLADTVIAAYVPTVDVEFVEGERYASQLIGVSGNTANQRWQFPQQNVVKSSISLTVGGVGWAEITSWVTQSSSSNVYSIVQTDDGNTFVQFGDGVYGAIPASGAEIRATFRVGGGTRGNLAINTITRKVSMPAQVLSLTNTARASGGKNAASMKEAKAGIPATITTLERAVTVADHALLALRVAGVSKARAGVGYPVGTNKIRLWIAPSGGGAPTTALRSDVSSYLFSRKMVGRRINVMSPVYKNVRLTALLHVNNNYRVSDVLAATRNGLINSAGSGLLDFENLDFGAYTLGGDGNIEFLLGQTRLQAYFDGLQRSGLDRAEILQLDVEPSARAKETGNSGDGTVTGITLSGRQRRREFYVELVSSAQYRVYERVVGKVELLTDTELIDYEKDFAQEEISSYSGYLLCPDRESPLSTVPIVSASGQTVYVSGSGGFSMFSLTEVGKEYFLYNPTTTLVNVGSEFTSADSNVRFTVTAGASPFIAGDAFTLDVYPAISDIKLKDDEFPNIVDGTLTLRATGGSKV